MTIRYNYFIRINKMTDMMFKKYYKYSIPIEMNKISKNLNPILEMNKNSNLIL